ncbi:hypothetical protein SDRG_13028 [Saprolegnia diclina VS20]|uniref:HAT C-terminal dimerisation domain-containing protein n=1 Tax=Saprolegnia diclina (strain VS20) TaxID=1156394 RepID=T0Q6R5_SAPDV|nr:hypothetical protein SDRG_13028 [Saprolegnia diclina VS20]EQC29155.1 hypothetical protein SDRG_13028 [Saprolegnia diclina VS20]|eukprot:XP_008617333.1 hypothetical protein SDRG_13028 [Saprolegnia diclina VS20]
MSTAPDPERSSLDEMASDQEEDVVEFDQHGIPLDKNQVYGNKTFTHVCTLCTRDVATREGPVDAWKTVLVTTVHTSNACKHMANAHKTHPFSVDYIKDKLEKAVKRLADFDAGQDAAPSKKRLAFNIIDNDQFRTFVASFGGTAPTRASYNEIIEAEYAKFTTTVAKALHDTFALCKNIKFLSLMHDMYLDEGSSDVLEATKVLDAWIALYIDWTTHTEANVMDATGKSFDMWKLYKEVDVLKWFKDVGQVIFPSIAVLARVHLAKPMSNAFQERVFSTVSNIVTAKRNAGDPARVGKLIVLKQKWTGDRPDTKAKKCPMLAPILITY